MRAGALRSGPLSRLLERARERADLARWVARWPLSPADGGEGIRRDRVEGIARTRGAAIAGALALLFFSSLAYAQDKRPSEDEMFGGASSDKPATPAPTPTPNATPPASAGGAQPAPNTSGEPTSPTSIPPAAAASTAEPQAPPSGASTRDEALLGRPDLGPKLSADVAPENPLTIGGQLYLRAQSSALAHQYPAKWSLSSPNLLDTYFDARPNERVRAFIRGRVSYDPTAPPTGTSTPVLAGQTNSSSGAIAGSSATGFTTFNASRGPNAVLDQMWISFDIEHELFVTAGKQHVKWGTGRFWTPTDYLHPIKRNPLDVFDARPGTSMLKVHFPWEARGWNFYAFGVYEDPNNATNTLGQIAGAARAEIVEGAAELGLDVFAKRGQKPRVGTDVSFGLGDFDLYVDAGFHDGSDFTIVTAKDPVPQITCGTMTAVDFLNAFNATPASGIKTQVATGLTWARKYNDNDVFTLGAEYFYNSVGYTNPSIYPGLFVENQLNFFYTGRHYAAVFASLPAPYSWNYTTFTLSTIGNLSDRSFVTRLDYSVTLLTHLTLEAFGAVHYGTSTGEFRLGIDTPAIYSPTCVINPVTGMMELNQISPAQHRDPAVMDLGIALRLAI